MLFPGGATSQRCVLGGWPSASLRRVSARTPRHWLRAARIGTFRTLSRDPLERGALSPTWSLGEPANTPMSRHAGRHSTHGGSTPGYRGTSGPFGRPPSPRTPPTASCGPVVSFATTRDPPRHSRGAPHTARPRRKMRRARALRPQEFVDLHLIQLPPGHPTSIADRSRPWCPDRIIGVANGFGPVRRRRSRR